MTAKANIKFSSHLHYKTLVIQALFPLLRHLNTGTLSVVMMVALALLTAMRDTDAASRRPVVENATIARAMPDGSRVWLKTSTPPGVQEIICFRQPVPISEMHQRRSKSTGENN